MISPIVQAFDPIVSFIGSLFLLPWTVWVRLKEIIRSTVSLNGYTAMDPDGVLGEGGKEVNNDKNETEEKEEGEEKE